MKLVILLLLLTIPAMAFDYEPPLPDAEQEEIAQEVFSEIRCLVCDGESLTDSSADYSVAMRALIREQIASGKNKKQVVEYLTDRYGIGVLQSPPKQGGALLLWLTPLLLIIFGIFAMRRRKK